MAFRIGTRQTLTAVARTLVTVARMATNAKLIAIARAVTALTSFVEPGMREWAGARAAVAPARTGKHQALAQAVMERRAQHQSAARP